jgi:hypothetical protein
MDWPRLVLFAFPPGHTWDERTLEAVERARERMGALLHERHVPALLTRHIGSQMGPHLHGHLSPRAPWGALARIFFEETGSKSASIEMTTSIQGSVRYCYYCEDCDAVGCAHKTLWATPGLLQEPVVQAPAAVARTSLGVLRGERAERGGASLEDACVCGEPPPSTDAHPPARAAAESANGPPAEDLTTARPLTAADLLARLPHQPCRGRCGASTPYGWYCRNCLPAP